MSGDFVDSLAASVGVPAPGLRILVSLLIQYPLAIGMARFASVSPTVKHLYSAVCGLALAYFNFGPTIAHCVLTTFVTWLMLVLLPRRLSVGVVFVFNAAYLLIGYLAVSTDGYDVDWTLPQCILCLRLIGLAWDLFDGTKPRDSLRTDQLENHIVDVPSLLEMFGYSFFFTAVLTGPQFPLRLYRNFINGKIESVIDSKHITPAQLRSSAVRAAIGRFAVGVVYLVAVTVGQALVPASLLGKLDTMPLWQALVVLIIVGNLGLRKYLAVWLINEGSCILTGISLELNPDVKGKATDVSQINWGGVANVLPWVFETATNVNHKISSFNINTNDWAKRYIFKRLQWVGNKDVSTVAALVFLSLWHGFKPGYAFTFSAEFIVLMLQSRIIARHIQFGLDKSTMYAAFVCFPVVFVVSAYAYVPFETLTWLATVKMFSDVYWFLHVAVISTLSVELVLEAMAGKKKNAPTAATGGVTAATGDKKQA